MTEENILLEPQTIPSFEQAGYQLPDFELEEGEIHYVDLSDEYFDLLEPEEHPDAPSHAL